MRSEIVFRAQDSLSNRYELCRTTAKVTRLLHFLSHYTADAINDAFVRVANPPRGPFDTLEEEAQCVACSEHEKTVMRVA